MTYGFKRSSIPMMILLVVITYGIYIPIWFLKRIGAFKDLNSKLKLNKYIMIVILVLMVVSLILLIPSYVYMDSSIGEIVDQADKAIALICGLAVLAMSFDMRRIMQDHFGIKLSGAGTFFFTMFYLQYKINELIKNGKIAA